MKLRPSLPATPGGLAGPIFVPDATHGVLKGVGGDELEDAGVRVLMANALHLMRAPGIGRVRALGGLKTMMAWRGVLMTDSGGFQALSLIREAGAGRVAADGLRFKLPGGRKVHLTPERAIRDQLRLEADVLFCLDDCTQADAPRDEQAQAVERTLAWARSCKRAFVSALGGRVEDPARPRLFGIVQGGRDAALRLRCAETLLDIGFDGFGFGGWPLDTEGHLLEDMLALVRDAVPESFPLHALGVGHPVSVAACARLGYTLCDSSLPTRDARRGRLYRFRDERETIRGDDWFEFVYVTDERHARVRRPISADCGCVACTQYSLGYLNYLARREEPLFWRLATLHNLTFMRRLTDLLAAERVGGCETTPSRASEAEIPH